MVLSSSPFHRVNRETAQERWILAAFTLAIILHLLVALSFGWIQIPALAVPVHEAPKTFTLHPISIPPISSSVSPVATPDLNPDQLTQPHPLPSNTDISIPSKRQDLPSSANLIPTRDTPPIVIEPTLPHGANSGNSPSADLPGMEQAIETPSMQTLNLPKPELMQMPADVLFAFDQATLLPEATPRLQKAADAISKYPQAAVQVNGYSDSIGEPGYNQKLSELRAQAVQQWLMAHVSPGKYTFQANGHGSSDFQVEPTGSKEQQAQNRRVELFIQPLKF